MSENNEKGNVNENRFGNVTSVTGEKQRNVTWTDVVKGGNKRSGHEACRKKENVSTITSKGSLFQLNPDCNTEDRK